VLYTGFVTNRKQSKSKLKSKKPAQPAKPAKPAHPAPPPTVVLSARVAPSVRKELAKVAKRAGYRNVAEAVVAAVNHYLSSFRTIEAEVTR
jgi:hypothetical protein